MSLSVRGISNFVLLATLMGGAAVSASAQQIRFHLPFDAKWGRTVMPAGDYRVHVPDQSVDPTVVFMVSGPTKSSFIMPLNADIHGGGDLASYKDHLRLVKVDGEYFVSKYESPLRGITYTFKTPAPKHRVQMTTAQGTVDIAVEGD